MSYVSQRATPRERLLSSSLALQRAIAGLQRAVKTLDTALRAADDAIDAVQLEIDGTCDTAPSAGTTEHVDSTLRIAGFSRDALAEATALFDGVEERVSDYVDQVKRSGKSE